MLTVQEAIEKINQDKDRAERDLQLARNKDKQTEIILGYFADLFEELIKQTRGGNYNVDIGNLPKIQDISGKVSVEGLSSLLHAINKLQSATKENKISLPEVQRVSGEITVKNPTPPAKIPAYPKQLKTDVNSLPKYIQELLSDIKKSINEIELRPEIKVDLPEPEVKVINDFNKIEKYLAELRVAISSLPAPQVNIDTKEIVRSNKKVEEAIENISFPVPNFQSSYQKSLSMQSEDLGKDYTWTTDGGKDVVETITFRGLDGKTYRKTYSYDGSGKVASESAWEVV